jgi:threonine/homoserine/homoserine lactone efflux protein
MFGIHDLGLFVAAGVLLNVTPGADFLYVLSRGAAGGFRAGFWAALGVGAGCFVHVAAAAVGLSALLASSAAAFAVVKWLGAVYLAYLGVSMLLARRQPLAAGATVAPPAAGTRVFWQGFATNVLNPKVALFFLAFMPHFISPASDSKVYAFLLLGTIFNATGTAWNILVARCAAYLTPRLAGAAPFGAWLSRLLGGLFVLLAARLAVTQRA